MSQNNHSAIDLYLQVKQTYKGAKAAIEALTGVEEGSIGYATDADEFGSYNGTVWTWGQGGIFNGDITQSFKLSGDITPSALSADQNDWNPTGLSTASIIRASASGANRSITGLAGGADGRIIIIHNIGSTYTIFLINESSSSTDVNRLALNGTIDIVPDGVVILQYDSTTQRWRAMNTSAAALQGSPITAGLKNSLVDNDILRWHSGDGNWQRNTHLSDTNNPHATTAAQVTAIPNSGWIAGGGGTWSYTSADDPIFVASVPDADAALISVGYKIKLTQTSVKYFIVHAKGTPSGGFTPVTIYGGTDYDLANAAISSPYYSPVKCPLDFPMDDDKWTVSASNTVNAHKTPPAQNIWYGGVGLTNTGISIDVPIGAWRGYSKAVLEVEDTTVTDYNIYMTFSNANNSESNTDNTGFVALTAPSGTYKVWNVLVMPIKVTITSKTTHYLNIKTSTTTADAIHMRGDVVPTIIKLVDNYL